MSLDAVDYKILYALMTQGRMTWSELASLLELSAPATSDRVRRLEERQIIQGYTALIAPEAVGCQLTAFIAVTLSNPEQRQPFLTLVDALPEIQECHHVTGDDDYWLKVRCRNPKDLERLLSDELKGKLGALKTRTTIVLSTAKETTQIPLSPP